MKKTALFLPLLVVVLFLGSCGKYEDGPAFSLLTKKARLTGEWKVEKVFKNDVEEELDSLSQNTSILYESDGTGKITFTQGSVSLAIDFEWQFGDGKETISMRTKKLDGTWDDWDETRILRLTNKEFWFEETSTTSTDIYETHFAKV